MKTRPPAPHALHMPSHIFTRVGAWQESATSNLRSATVARLKKSSSTDYMPTAFGGG